VTRDWTDHADAWEAHVRDGEPATIGDVREIALEIAGDNDDSILRLVAALDGRLREIESERHSVARLWEAVDRLRADFGAMADRLERAEAALVDAHRRQDGLGGRLPAAEREIGRLATRVAVLEEYLREAEAWIGERRQEDRARVAELEGRS